MDFRDRLVDLVLQDARLVGEDDLVPAEPEQIGASSARLMLVERLDPEVRSASLESLIDNLAVVDNRDDHNRDGDAMRQRAQMAYQLLAIELNLLVVCDN